MSVENNNYYGNSRLDFADRSKLNYRKMWVLNSRIAIEALVKVSIVLRYDFCCISFAPQELIIVGSFCKYNPNIYRYNIYMFSFQEYDKYFYYID